MKREMVVEHVSIEIESSFDPFTFQLEKALGILNPFTLKALGAVPASMASYLKGAYQENELVLFNILLLGDLLNKENSIKIKQYQVGNPRIMHRIMTKLSAAGLYFPLQLLVYEKPDGKVVIDYDLPSSLFKQFNDEEILSDSMILENNLIKLIQAADKENGMNGDFFWIH